MLHFSGKGSAFVSASVQKGQIFTFYSDAVCISGSDIIILANALKTNKRVLKYINTFTEGLSLL